MSGDEGRDGNRTDMHLSKRDKIWVAVAVIALIVGLVLAVIFDL